MKHKSEFVEVSRDYYVQVSKIASINFESLEMFFDDNTYLNISPECLESFRERLGI